MKRYAVLSAIVVITALSLSAVWGVPYVYTLIGFSAWALLGHLLTVDDDMAGGWSNPDGSLPFPWMEIAAKAAPLAALSVVAYWVPAVRLLGAV